MSDFLSDLNPAQRQAVTHEGTPLLILAGAGSGKTRALTYRAAYLISQKKIPQDRILLTTFTNKAAQEMQSRLESLVGFRLSLAGTFHSLCARLLRRHGPHINLDRDFVIYDTADQLQLLKTVMKDLRLDPKETRPNTFAHLIESAKQELITPIEYGELARGPVQTQTAKVYALYQKKLTTSNALDFNDLLMKAIDLLKKDASIRHAYQQQLLHVLVDEYQDTNKAQYQLTKLLVGQHQNLCVVGDASQAIYSWRGADYRNLQLLKQDYPKLTTIKLEQNYRSTQNILDAAYGVIAFNHLHPVLSLWTESPKGQAITIYQAKDEYDEAKFILRQIHQIQTNNSLNLSDFAVLYRTNAQSRVFEEVFIREGIPYILVGGVKFYDRREVKDVLSYLRYAYNPKDIVSFERLIKLGKRRFAGFETWLKRHSDLALSPVVILDKILETTQYLSRFDSQNPEDLSRIENVKELRSVAQNFETLADFLENVALVEQDTTSQGWVTPDKSINSSENQDAVILMTLHASKGLEFDTVFMVGMEEGLFPHSRSLLSLADLEEERRLCYVGLTRARQKVYLSYAASRTFFGTRNHNDPSRFISEIPETVTESFSGTSPGHSVASAISDDLLDKFINDEIDIDEFLQS